MGRNVEQTLAVLNGLVGDYLARTRNGLATEMALYSGGQAVPLEAAAMVQAYPSPRVRVVVLVHGLMTTENVWQMADGTDYGSRLQDDLGYTPAYARYNTGAPIADNGTQLAALLHRFSQLYPGEIQELLLVGYSMGGLLIRSACHVASLEALPWLQRVRRIVYVGTPHLGAPAERVGKLVSGVLRFIKDPYTRLIADVADLRSAGLKDLGHADLRVEDRTLARSPFSLRDARHPLPLLPGIAHDLIAGDLLGNARLALFGDSVVPLHSATYVRQAPEGLAPNEHVHVLSGLSHVALARHLDVYAVLRKICEEEPCHSP